MTLGMAMIIFRYDTKAQSIQERTVSWTSLLKTKQTHIHSLTHKKPTSNVYTIFEKKEFYDYEHIYLIHHYRYRESLEA